MMPRIVRTDCELECPLVDETLRVLPSDLVLLPESVTEADLVEAVRDASLILVCYTQITAAVLEAARNLKGIIKYGVGIDAIDLAAAQARHIPVVNIPEYAEETVAEGAFALMIALSRKLKPLIRTMERDGWAWPTQCWRGNDLAGRTLGLVGTGRIGKSLARMAGSGFRMRVLGFDPYVDAATMAAAGIEKRTDLEDMLAACDVVSLHMVLNDETRGLFGTPQLAAMQPHALLINVSRGALVDEAALAVALAEGRIGGAGLDVFSEEPLKRSGHPLSRLFDMDNVILSPHLTFYTKEAMERLERETLQRCMEILQGRPLLVKSRDPRLRSQTSGVCFSD